MKYYLLILPVLIISSCSSAPRPVANTSETVNSRSQTNDVKSVLAHTSEGQQRPSANSNGAPGKWTRGGDPIDTSQYNKAIASAEKEYKSKPNDDGAKKALAEAYFDRGFALTEARQYASALGDYRRTLKLDPNHEEAKKWIDQIQAIYKTVNKVGPAEGEEPEPLPLQKPER